jgi:hypothetical protein
MTSSLIITRNNAKVVNDSSFVITPAVPIEFTNQQIAVCSTQLFYSWGNINASKYNNHEIYFQFVNDGAFPKKITIPDGFYTVNDLENYIQLQFFKLGYYFTDNTGTIVYPFTMTENSVYYSTTVSFICFPLGIPAGWTFGPALSDGQKSINTFTFFFNDAFGKLIGFTGGTSTYISGANNMIPSNNSVSISVNSNTTPEISPVSGIFINTNLVNSYNYNSQYNKAIYSFNDSGISYGNLISKNPANLIWFDIINGRYDELNFSFVSQDGRTNVPIKDNSGTIITLLIRNRTKD